MLSSWGIRSAKDRRPFLCLKPKKHKKEITIMEKDKALVKFQFDNINYDMEIIDQDGEKWVPANQVGEALGNANIRNLIRSMKEREELKEGVHIRTFTTKMVGDTQPRKITILSRLGIIRVGMRSDGKRAIAFRDWAEDVLFKVMTTGSYSLLGAGSSRTDSSRHLLDIARETERLSRTFTHMKHLVCETGLSGKRAIVKANKLTKEKTGVDVLEMLEIDNELSPLEAFIEQRMDISPEKSVSPPVLFTAYKDWCAEMEVSPARKYDFYLRITTDLPVKRRRPTNVSKEVFEGCTLNGGAL
jgi:prophage antirepressor-like protein